MNEAVKSVVDFLINNEAVQQYATTAANKKVGSCNEDNEVEWYAAHEAAMQQVLDAAANKLSNK